MTTLGHEFPKEIERTKVKLSHYMEIPAASRWFAETLIRDILRRAEKAWAEQDTIAMIGLYKEMQEIEG